MRYTWLGYVVVDGQRVSFVYKGFSAGDVLAKIAADINGIGTHVADVHVESLRDE